MSERALVRVPARARPGEIISISALASHPMENGYRVDGTGTPVPRNIIGRFSCRFESVEIFRAELHPAITANPYLSFDTVAQRSGEFQFEWVDDRGTVIRASARITVE